MMVLFHDAIYSGKAFVNSEFWFNIKMNIFDPLDDQNY